MQGFRPSAVITIETHKKKKMKRTIIALLLLAATTSMEAQYKQEGFSIIPRIGFNSSKTTDHQYWGEIYSGGSSKKHHETNHKMGYVFGIDADYAYAKRLSTTLGLSYSNEGFELERLTQYMNFVNMTVLENFYVLPGLALKTGLQYGYLESAELKDPDISPRRGYRKKSNRADYNNYNLSIPIGVSYEYKNVILDLRYNIGLWNLYAYDLDDYRTRSLWLTLGYRIHL